MTNGDGRYQEKLLSIGSPAGHGYMLLLLHSMLGLVLDPAVVHDQACAQWPDGTRATKDEQLLLPLGIWGWRYASLPRCALGHSRPRCTTQPFLERRA